MRYYTVKAVTATDNTESRDMRGFDTLDEALVRFHSDLSSSISKCSNIMMMIVNSAGGVYKQETWTAAVEETTEEETTEA